MRNIFRFFIFFLLLAAAWQLGRTLFFDQEQEIRNEIRASFEQGFNQKAQDAQQQYGLKPLHQSSHNGIHIVLIHGLDDPGKVWMNLAPKLLEQQYAVWEMNYPNDQAIAASAELFRNELITLGSSGISEVVVIAHSMGGLITREVLTNPQWQCPAACTDNEIPTVKQLIMVGTPNHGSELARFRMLGEIREQIERLLDGQADWLGWIFDGAGEAGIDLIPGSDFLVSLNQRPLPDNTDYFIIAGVIGEQERKLLKGLLEPLENHQALTDLLDKLIDTIGDGLVTLDSTRLENVPAEIVAGNHMTIIRNVSRSSSSTPPAIPIIMKKIPDMNNNSTTGR